MKALSLFITGALCLAPLLADSEIRDRPPYRGQVSNNPKHEVLPDIRDVLSLCNDDEFKNAHDMLTELWNQWIIENSLTDDQHICLHFLEAYIQQRLGNIGVAEANISRVYLFQISHHFKPQK